MQKNLPIERHNGLYWVFIPLDLNRLEAPTINMALVEADALSVSAEDQSLLWATRMVCDARQLDLVKGSVQGLEHIGKANAKARQLIDTDRFRVKASNKRALQLLAIQMLLISTLWYCALCS